MFLVVAAQASLVDRIVVVVGDRLVTASDIAFETEFDPHDTSPLAALERPEYAIEDRLVHFAIFRDLAGDIGVFRPTPAEVAARHTRFRESWAHAEDAEAFLARWGLDDDALQGFLYSRLVVEKYITRNLSLLAGSTNDPYPAWADGHEARTRIRRP